MVFFVAMAKPKLTDTNFYSIYKDLKAYRAVSQTLVRRFKAHLSSKSYLKNE